MGNHGHHGKDNVNRKGEHTHKDHIKDDHHGKDKHKKHEHIVDSQVTTIPTTTTTHLGQPISGIAPNNVYGGTTITTAPLSTVNHGVNAHLNTAPLGNAGTIVGTPVITESTVYPSTLANNNVGVINTTETVTTNHVHH